MKLVKNFPEKSMLSAATLRPLSALALVITAPIASRSASVRLDSAPRASSPASVYRRSPRSPMSPRYLAKRHSCIADGGIRFSGDMSKALAAGASRVMLGGMFCGYQRQAKSNCSRAAHYKSYRGMGSVGAMQRDPRIATFKTRKTTPNDKFVPEGVEGRVPYKGSMFRRGASTHRRAARQQHWVPMGCKDHRRHAS